MFETFNRLPDFYQGLVFIIAGATAMLYALGIIQKGITIIVVLFALYMISVGCVKVGLYQKAVDTLFKDKKK